MKKLGGGMGSIAKKQPTEGVVKWVHNPQETIALAKQGVANVIALVRGGTCSFASLLLARGVPGIITLEGAPQSHLGITSREFGVPCVMTFTPEDPSLVALKQTNYEEYIAKTGAFLEGKKVRLDMGGAEHDGYVDATVYELA